MELVKSCTVQLDPVLLISRIGQMHRVQQGFQCRGCMARESRLDEVKEVIWS